MITVNSGVTKPLGIFLSAVLMLTGICSSHAQTTNKLYWNFSGSATPTSGVIIGLSTAFSSGNVSSSGFNSTSASSGYSTAAGFGASGITNAYVNKAPIGSLDTASSAYFSFSLSLSVVAGTGYTVSDISFGSYSTGTGPTTLSLYESTDNSIYASSGSSLNVGASSKWAAEDFSGISIALPDDSSTIYFRIYGSDGTGTAGNGNWRIDDLAVTMVSVPEPSTVAFAMIGGVACLFSFRRKR